MLEKLTATVTAPTDPAAVSRLTFSGHVLPGRLRTRRLRVPRQGPAGSSNPFLLTFAHNPVVLDNDANDTMETAQEVTPPCEIAGRFEKLRDRDWYAFTAKKGDVYNIELLSGRLGAPTLMVLVSATRPRRTSTSRLRTIRIRSAQILHALRRPGALPVHGPGRRQVLRAGRQPAGRHRGRPAAILPAAHRARSARLPDRRHSRRRHEAGSLHSLPGRQPVVQRVRLAARRLRRRYQSDGRGTAPWSDLPAADARRRRPGGPAGADGRSRRGRLERRDPRQGHGGDQGPAGDARGAGRRPDLAVAAAATADAAGRPGRAFAGAGRSRGQGAVEHHPRHGQRRADARRPAEGADHRLDHDQANAAVAGPQTADRGASDCGRTARPAKPAGQRRSPSTTTSRST